MTAGESGSDRVDELEGEIAVVTGSTRGIGNAIARELAGAGARVVLTGRDRETAAVEAEDVGPRHVGLGIDIRSRASIDAAVEEILARLGEPSILVNNAGVNQIEPAEEFTEEVWSEIIDVNLTGAFRCCQAFGSRMLAAGHGTIVNVASITGPEIGMAGRAPYAASKGGLVGLTRVLAVEWADRGVRVNAVLPGPVRTPMVEKAIREGFVDEKAIAARTPAGRIAEPEDIARAVLLLVSDRAEFVTGQTLVVDGGYAVAGVVPCPDAAS